MDPDKILKFVSDNFSDWLRVTYLTLIHPISRFELVSASEEQTRSLVGSFTSERQMWLNPKLLSFAVLSIILGATISSLLPNRLPAPQLFITVVFILISWFSHASLLHVGCKIMRGTGKYEETVSVSLQVFATIYVFSNFLSLLVATVCSVPFISSLINEIPFIGEPLVEEPALWFFLIGTFLHLVYVPISLSHVHKFGRLRLSLTIIFSFLFIILSLYFISIPIYHRTGIMAPPTMK